MAVDATLGEVISGPYTATWNALNLGHTLDGFRWTQRTQAIDINADVFGPGTIIDSLFAGASMQVSFTLENYTAAAVDTLINWWTAAEAGDKRWALAQPLILTSCGTATPASVTFHKALLAAGQDVEILLAHRPRFIPIVMDIFPIDAASYASDSSLVRVQNCSAIKFYTAA